MNRIWLRFKSIEHNGEGTYEIENFLDLDRIQSLSHRPKESGEEKFVIILRNGAYYYVDEATYMYIQDEIAKRSLMILDPKKEDSYD